MKKPDYYFSKLDPALREKCNSSLIGVRLAMYGAALVGIDPARAVQRKKLYVFVETNRRAADSISLVTGCTIGNRRMKFFDYGVLAASFLNAENGCAARVSSKVSPKDLIAQKGSRVSFEKFMTEIHDDDLFNADMNIHLEVDFYDRPGAPRKKVQCDACGINILDNRHVRHDDRVLCRPCTGDTYWTARAS